MRCALLVVAAVHLGLIGCSGASDVTPKETGCELKVWYPDADGDSYGVTSTPTEACAGEAPDGHVLAGGDCADADPLIHPGAAEVCDGADNDCNSLVDDDVVDAPVWHADADGDTWGDPDTAEASCTQPPGFVLNDGDCDDRNPDISPDGEEVCNGEDDDCDGTIDDPDELEVEPWYPDADGDGYGDPDGVVSCEPATGFVEDGTDCDDADASIYPGAAEICDGKDQDCDGVIDNKDEITYTSWWPDGDGDGYGDDAGEVVDCAPPKGFVEAGGDCDDVDPSINPGAEDVCEDGVDQDCDGSDACTAQTGLLLNEWNASTQHAWDPLTGAMSVYHTTQANDADCNEDQGRSDGWVVEHFGDQVLWFNPGAGSGATLVVSTTYAYPKHVAVVDGDVLVMSRNDGIIKRYSGVGAELASVATGYATGQGIATDGSSIYVSVWDGVGARLQRYDMSLSLIEEVPLPTGMTYGNLTDLAYDARTGLWYGMDASGEGGTGTNTTVVVEFDMGGAVTGSTTLPFAIDGIGVLACP